MLVKPPLITLSGISEVLRDNENWNWCRNRRKPPTNRGLSTRHIDSNVTSFYGSTGWA